jgi:hypothetical protein
VGPKMGQLECRIVMTSYKGKRTEVRVVKGRFCNRCNNRKKESKSFNIKK